MSRQTASSWLKRHGLQANHRPHQRPDPAELAADYRLTRSIRRLADQFGISSAVMRTWLFEAGIEPLGKAGRPRMNIDIDDVRARRARGDSVQKLAEQLDVSPDTIRRRLQSVDHPRDPR